MSNSSPSKHPPPKKINDGARTRPHYKIADLMQEMGQHGLELVEGWDEMPAVGLEKV